LENFHSFKLLSVHPRETFKTFKNYTSKSESCLHITFIKRKQALTCKESNNTCKASSAVR
jgi:hypothetical protein